MAMKRRGVALITALMVVALASIAATALMSTASLSIHRTEALRDSEAAWWVARGAEAWVLGILKDDKDKSYDGLDEPWAQPVEALPIDQGVLHGRVVDGQGRFNLNNLLVAVPAGGTDRYGDHFKNLLSLVASSDSPMPTGLIGAIRDWGDLDTSPTPPEGAEDETYLSEDPPYRTANRLFTTVSELLAIKGMTPELYARLSHLVTVLPEQKTEINVNTAEPEVLYAMPGANQAQLRSFIDKRDKAPIKDSNSYNSQNFFGATAPPGGFATHWFQIQGEVFVGSSRVGLYSLINRPTGKPPVVIDDSAEIDTVEPEAPPKPNP